ncbi:MAG: prepilin peptidase, partial [Candidatus Binatia bacterium]
MLGDLRPMPVLSNIDTVVALCSVLFGLVVGSFLNVCIARIPHGASIVFPSSHCPRCGHSLSWYENLPVMSYIGLRGRCRSCNKKISIRYPLVELLTALLFFGFSRAGFAPLEFLVYAAFGSALVVITFIDLDHYIIPDVITLPSLLVAPAVAFVVKQVTVVESLVGILTGGGILWFVAWLYERVRKQEGMGLGDVKLLAMVGGFLGWQAAIFT